MVRFMSRIFISYSRVDEGFAQRVAERLSDWGVEVWIDVASIPAGANWSNAIDEGLRVCDLMLLILSPESMASPNVEDEWQSYRDANKLIIPLLLRPAKIHYQLGRLQYIDFSNQEFDRASYQLHRKLTSQGIVLKPVPALDADQSMPERTLSSVQDAPMRPNQGRWLFMGVTMVGGLLIPGSLGVVPQFISRYTNIPALMITPTQYLSAGAHFTITILMMLVGSLVIGIATIRKKNDERTSYSRRFRRFFRRGGTICFAVVILLFPVFVVVNPPVEIGQSIAWVFGLLGGIGWIMGGIIGFYQDFVDKTYPFEWMRWLLGGILAVFSVLAAFVLASLYGYNLFAYIPRSVFGGQPLPISITLTSSEVAQLLGLETNTGGRSESFCLLTEVRNGLLVYSPAQERAFVIKDEQIVSYGESDAEIDCSPPARIQPIVGEAFPEITPDATTDPSG